MDQDKMNGRITKGSRKGVQVVTPSLTTITYFLKRLNQESLELMA